MLLMRFVHFLGMSLWIGGMVAAMVLSANAKSATGVERNAAFRWAGRMYSLIVGPGALLTVITGLALTMSLAQRGASQVMAHPSIWVMQVTGLAAGVLVLFLALPTAATMARMADAAADGELPPSFGGKQRRLSVVVHLVAVLVVLSLYFGTAVR